MRRRSRCRPRAPVRRARTTTGLGCVDDLPLQRDQRPGALLHAAVGRLGQVGAGAEHPARRADSTTTDAVVVGGTVVECLVQLGRPAAAESALRLCWLSSVIVATPSDDLEPDQLGHRQTPLVGSSLAALVRGRGSGLSRTWAGPGCTGRRSSGPSRGSPARSGRRGPRPASAARPYSAARPLPPCVWTARSTASHAASAAAYFAMLAASPARHVVAGVVQRRRLLRHQPGQLDLDRRLRQRVRDRLVRADRRVPDLALLGVLASPCSQRVAGRVPVANDAAMMRSGLSPANSCSRPASSSPTSASAGSRTSSKNSVNCFPARRAPSRSAGTRSPARRSAR